MVSPLIFNDRFLWNVSADVGQGKPNKLDDVELVRFGYLAFLTNPPTISQAPEKFRTALTRMRTIGPFGQDLQDVIVQHELTRGGTQDGCVSVMHPNRANRGTYDGKHIWIILSLNNNMKDILRDLYPRIDRHTQSGLEISKVVEKFMVGAFER